MSTACRSAAVTAAFVFLLVSLPGFGQSSSSPSTGSKGHATGKPAATSTSNGSAAKSINEIRKETLLYGIDSQIIDLLGTLTQEKDTALNGDVEQIFAQSANPQVRQAAVNFLDTVKDWNATTTARKIIANRIQTGSTGNDKLITSTIQYLTDAKDTAALPQISQLVQDQSQAVAFEALVSIGKIGSAPQAESLLKDLQDPQFPSALKPQVVLALGDLKSEAAVPELTKIFKNQDQQAVMRRYACYALGKIGDPASIPVIKEAFSESDTYLRAYAVSAIANYNGAEVDSLLIQALKDSFWRVRVNAAESLGKKKVVSAIPILEYKARYDPEAVVQRTALSALGEIDTPETMAFLRKVFSNSLIDPALRTVAVDQLISKDLSGSLTELEKFIHSEWDKPNSHLLDYVCNHLSQAKDPKLEPLFERFLGSPSLNIQIYGLRGIRGNDFKSLLKKVEPFDNPKNNASVRAAAEQAITTLK